MRVYVLEPVLPEFLKALNDHRREKILSGNRVKFPAICQQDLAAQMLIEPKEISDYHFEVFLPAYVKVAKIYAYVKNGNAAAEGETFGWETSTLHEVAQSTDPDSEKYRSMSFRLPVLCKSPG